MNPMPRSTWLSVVIGLLAVWGSMMLAGAIAGLVAPSRWTPIWSAALFAAVLLAYSLGTAAGRRTPAHFFLIGAVLILPLELVLLALIAWSQWLWPAHVAAAPLNVGYFENSGPDGFPFGYIFIWPLITLAIAGLAIFLREVLLPHFEQRFRRPPEQ